MVILDFTDKKEQAFIRGFSKGITAPVMLFEHFTAPSLPEVKQIPPPSISDAQAIENDWKAIGGDFSNASVASSAHNIKHKLSV